MNRRDFIKVGAMGAGSMLFPLSEARAVNRENPHFFLQLFIQDGADSLFLFDGRPKALTASGLIHDHVKEEAQLWAGTNGVNCLATAQARRLAPHRQNFSVINGVFMATSFDGHPQNINFLFTGNPFGGESYVAHMNERESVAYTKRPLDALQFGVFPLDQTNGGSTIPLSLESAFNLVDYLKTSRPLDSRHAVLSYINSRYARLGAGPGRFSKGAAEMARGYVRSPDLAERLKKLELTPADQHANMQAGFIELMSGFFREGICSSALLRVGPTGGRHLDVHGGDLAQGQTEMYIEVMDQITRVFDLLASTPYDKKRSLFDVTTVMVASEFGRTLRQPSLSLADTGTDHNSLNNSMLIGGKGIRGGLVIGATDQQVPGEKVSGAHKILDSENLKLIGRPFDFDKGIPRNDKPDTYKQTDYLNVASVVNTLYSCLSVPEKRWRTVERDGPKAPVIRSLLA